MSFLLDTNVVSELRKRSPDAGVAAWFDSVDSRQLYLSVLTVGEIRQGICRLQRRDRAQAAVFDQWLTGLLCGYSDRVVPVTAEVAEEWGRLNVPECRSLRRCHSWQLFVESCAWWHVRGESTHLPEGPMGRLILLI